MASFDFIHHEGVTWVSGDKAGLSRIIFRNIKGNLRSLSVSLLDDEGSTDAECYAIVYGTADKGDTATGRLGCSENRINPYLNRGKVVTFTFSDIPITSDFFIEFYREQQWNEAEGSNYRVTVRMPSKNVASNASMLALLNASPLYGAHNSMFRWMLGVSIAYTRHFEIEEMGLLERNFNRVTELSDANTDAEYPSARAVYKEIARLADSVTTPMQLADTLNLTSLQEVQEAQETLTAEGEARLFLIADDMGTYPTDKDAVLAPAEVVKALSLSSPGEGARKLLTNWEAYYKVSGSWYSQNISSYLMGNVHAVPFRTGDVLLLMKHRVRAVDFIARFIDFADISVTASLTTAQKLLWNTYKASIGCSGKSDGDTIKAMIEKDLIYGSTDNVNYSPVSSGGYVVMYDCKVIGQQRPLPVFSGTFNSGNDCDLPGIYNSISLGRPPGSASNETYTLVVKNDGSQWAYSKSVAGRNFYRRSKFDEWVSLGIG